MRRLALFVASAALLAPRPGISQVQFEGTVRGRIEAGGLEVETVQHMKGSMMRVDMTVSDVGEVSQITNVETGKSVVIMHSEQMWVDMSVMGGFMPGGPAASPADAKMPEIRDTGREGEIAGHECRYYMLIMEGGHEVEVCSAGGLGCFVPGAPAGLDRGESASIPGLPQDAERWTEHFADGFFILSMKAEDATYIASEIEPGTPPDELFSPPAGYREMSIPHR